MAEPADTKQQENGGGWGWLKWPAIAAGVGLAGWGGWAWYQRSKSTPTPSPTPDTTPDTKPSGGGGKTGGRPAGCELCKGDPPNLSGDSEGYNTNEFPDPAAVRLAFTQLGYATMQVEDPQKSLEGEDVVGQFQRDYNTVIEALDKGLSQALINKPGDFTGFQVVNNPSAWAWYRGWLTVDKIPGRRTLCAVEVIFKNQEAGNFIEWPLFVKLARDYLKGTKS